MGMEACVALGVTCSCSPGHRVFACSDSVAPLRSCYTWGAKSCSEAGNQKLCWTELAGQPGRQDPF